MTLTRRETYSARGRGLLLFALQQDKVGWDAQIADVMYGFFADGLSRHVCAGHIPHDEMVIDARRRLVAAGQAPAAVTQLKSNIAKTGNPWGGKEPDLAALEGVKPRSEVLVYFGPAARIRRPAAMTALAALLNKAGVDFSVLAEEGDPGLLLYTLGEVEAAAAAAQAVAEKIRRSGARTVVTPDAETYRTLKVGFGAVPALSGPAVQHSAEFLAEMLGRLRFRPLARSRVTYHDPCALARFARCLDAPRALVQAVCDAAPLEIGYWSRDLAHCSGECGGVPFTHPELSRKAAEQRVRAAREAGAELIVAGSPAAAASLEGCGLPVRELSEFVAEALVERVDEKLAYSGTNPLI